MEIKIVGVLEEININLESINDKLCRIEDWKFRFEIIEAKISKLETVTESIHDIKERTGKIKEKILFLENSVGSLKEIKERVVKIEEMLAKNMNNPS